MVRYINADELVDIIKSGKVARKDYLIIDVRDDDYIGGHIVNSLNIPSRELNDSDKARRDLVKRAENVELVIFHCMLSQERGPKAARIYRETRESSTSTPQDIAILRDGFSGFQQKFKDDPLLVEGWEKDIWASPWC
ncbi:Rhodanese-like protein [Fistulina hepatica ATCC 64428]|uniref:Rhodanese-like protein n=1 Tax=Fistulina hepatica ATCC 64428 TaxID=1128425 RepID=A0A0D7A9S6_9AGAR|nr:Rhodanese-like protein [Fistulina hepatica ATCC 64428]